MLSRLIDHLHRRGLVPRVSETERQALAAGTVWADGELFSGRPDLAALLAAPYPTLDPREQAFLDGPVEEVCRRLDPRRLAAERRLPPELWEYLKAEGFFGLAIPREWGGLGFSALGQSAVFAKLAARSLALSVVVLIPNSVGPGELLLAHGTAAQRRRWLPRLARGEEIPCFALTEPGAGSDAAALASRGVLFRGAGGEPRLRLDWDKRYITLAPVATLIGLAFRLDDPDNLLGRAEGGGEVGITVALVPADAPGVEIGAHHDPMGIPFPNGPIRGRGVELPLDAIPGGAAGAGRGWRMLMEALAAGRAISLPAQSVGGARHVARVSGAYSMVRRQFGVPIGRLEGIEEPLARIAGRLYLMEAARVYTCGALDAGHRPAVLSAVVKHAQTELMRQVAADGMDIVAGAALCRGPRNLLADAWDAAPIGITVEGANILTRSLIIFGQGAVRCHPWARQALDALAERDPRALRRAVAGWTGGLLRNAVRAAVLGLSRGRLARAPAGGPTARWQRRLAWASARFALLADLALLALGSRLKRREKLAGRFADALSWMYLTLAALRRFEAEGRPAEDLALVRWAAEHGLSEVQRALEGVCRNFEAPLVGALLRGPGLWWLRLNPLAAPPSDATGAAAAQALRVPGAQRDRLTAGLYLPTAADEPLARLELAFDLAERSREPAARLAAAGRRGVLPRGAAETVAAAGVAAGVISAEEAELLAAAAAARHDALAVDEYGPEEHPGAAPGLRPATAVAADG